MESMFFTVCMTIGVAAVCGIVLTLLLIGLDKVDV